MTTLSGFGLGLRREHYESVLCERQRIDWFEILSENYLVPGGRPLHFLERIRAAYPLAMHGVSLSIGSTAPLDRRYLRQLRALAARIEPAWISDHVCWTGIDGVNLHDLMPMPYTRRALRQLASRVQQVQDYLGRRILLENVSSYLTFRDNEMNEWEFLAELTRSCGCALLLDVNNVYVSARNHGFDPHDYLQGIPREPVQQIHLAGHRDCGNYLIDTHDAPVPAAVWDLYGTAVARFGNVPTMVERDANIPPLVELVAELDHARRIAASIAAKRAA
jgi:uncharacterized protein (UPF0276 family)